MPLPGFISSIADKAQTALGATPLGSHLPGGQAGHHQRPSSPDSSAQQSANHAAAQGGHKSHALDAIQYQIRVLGQQYTSSASPLQKIITVQKGVAIDYDSVSRDSKSFSKELYTWGQGEGEDIKDVSDRLAYLNFVQGQISSTLAVKLDNARSPFKALRDLEDSLQPRRNNRAALEAQIGRMEHDQVRGTERRLAELKDQLRKISAEDNFLEREYVSKKRKALRESEQLKWDAFREYGEKIILLSQAASNIIPVLPLYPPTPSNPYTGTETTGTIRASLQRALDNYKTGYIELPAQNTPAKLTRSDTLSFGESHASELSSIASAESLHYEPGLPMTPPPTHAPQHFLSEQHSSPKAETHQLPSASYISHTPSASQGTQPPQTTSTAGPGATGVASAKSSAPPAPATSFTPSVDTGSLNMSPAPVPGLSPGPDTTTPSSQSTPAQPAIDAPMPTIAETGIPVKTGAEGPGPASGSLHDIHAASPSAGPRSGGQPGNEPSLGSYGEEFQSSQHQGLGFQRDRIDPPAVSAAATAAPGVGKAGTGVGAGAGAAVGAVAAGGVAGVGAGATRSDTQVSSSSSSGPPPAVSGNPRYESAEEEKKRLQKEERDRVLGVGNPNPSSAPHYETAEEEKKRLEREERERILHGGSSSAAPPQGGHGDNSGEERKDEELPPYQDY